MRASPALLVAAALLPLLLGLNNELESVDAAQYATVARHMIWTGDWLHLEDTQGPFVNKPPLALWCEAASMSLFGLNSWAARLPSFLAAIALVWVAWRLGLLLFDRARAELGAVLVASMVAVQQSVADPKVDWALALCTASAVLCFVRARERPALHWLGWVFCGLAMLSKGPLGLCLIGAAIVPEALRRGWFEGLSLPRTLWRARVLPGLGVIAAVCAPFYRAVHERDGAQGLVFLLLGQGFGKLVGKSGITDKSSHFFFLHTALWVFLPATPLLLAALWVRARGLWREKSLPPRPARLLVWWLIVPVLVFSFSEYKLPQYIYPLAVPVALLSADFTLGLAPRGLAWARGLMIAFAVLGAAASAALLGFVFPIGWAGALTMSLLGLLLVFPGVRFGGLGGAVVASMLCFELTYQLHFLPEANRFQLGRNIGELAQREDPRGKWLPFFNYGAPIAAGFYSGRDERGVDLATLSKWVRNDEAHLLLLPAGEWPDFAAAGLSAEKLARLPDYSVTRPRAAFLNPATRDSAVRWLDVVRVRPK